MTIWNMNTHGIDIFDPDATQGTEIDVRPYPAMRGIEHITMPISPQPFWPATPQAERVNRAARILCFLAAVANLAFGFAIIGQGAGAGTPAVTMVLAELALVVGGGVFVALIFALTE